MKLQAKKQMLTITMHEALVSGSVNIYKAEFEFDNTWDGYEKIAVFSAKNKGQSAYSVRREVLLSENSCVIPWEVLEEEGKLKIGVYGVREDKRLPTIYTDGEIILDGAEASSEGSAPTPEVVEQLLLDTKENREAAEKAAADAKADADRVPALAAQAAEKAVQSVQSAGDTQVQRVTDEGATQTANAKAQADAAEQSASEAAKSAQEAAGSASAAYTSETNAKASEEAAKASETAAKASEKAAADSASAAQQSATSAAESAAVYDTVLADVNQLKNDVSAITPDDTAVDGKPWTSKKIVDSLCQPFEESGNPVQCYPVENYPLGVKVSWEPTQEGSGDPSPDNIRPITGRDAVSVTRCGENLFDTRNIDRTSRGLHITSDDSGAVTIEGTVTGTGWPTVAYAYFPAGKYYFKTTDSSKLTALVGYTDKGVGVITLSEPNYIRIGIKGKDYSEAKTYQVSLTAGIDQPDTYATYTGSKTDITLPETVYGGTLDVESGVLTVDTALITADRSLFKLVSGSIKNYYQYMPGKYPMPYPDQTYLCKNTRCNVARIEEPYGAGLESDYLVYIIHDGRIRMSVGLYDSDADIKICYPIKDPYTIQLTEHQITALSGVNTIYTDADGVVVTGAEDPKHTITELKNAIISLGGNI